VHGKRGNKKGRRGRRRGRGKGEEGGGKEKREGGKRRIRGKSKRSPAPVLGTKSKIEIAIEIVNEHGNGKAGT